MFWLYRSLLALYLSGTPSQQTGARPPSCLYHDNRLFMNVPQAYITCDLLLSPSYALSTSITKSPVCMTSFMNVPQAYVCARHWKPNRTDLPKLNQLPQTVGQIVIDGIAVNSSYSTDVEVMNSISPVVLIKR